MKRGANWPALRARALKRDHHVCQRCRRARATEVHHVVRLADGGTDDLANLQSLCHACHKAEHKKPLSAARQAWADMVAELRTTR